MILLLALQMMIYLQNLLSLLWCNLCVAVTKMLLGTRQFGGRQFDGINLSASQFVNKPIWRENKYFRFTFTSVEATTKKFCYVIKAILCNCLADKSKNSHLKLLNALNLGMLLIALKPKCVKAKAKAVEAKMR